MYFFFERNSKGPEIQIQNLQVVIHLIFFFMQVENEKRATEVIKWRSNQRKLAEQEEALLSIQEGRQADRKVYEEFRLQKLKSGHLRSKGVFTGNHSEARAILDERMRPRTENKVSMRF